MSGGPGRRSRAPPLRSRGRADSVAVGKAERQEGTRAGEPSLAPPVHHPPPSQAGPRLPQPSAPLLAPTTVVRSRRGPLPRARSRPREEIRAEGRPGPSGTARTHRHGSRKGRGGLRPAKVTTHTGAAPAPSFSGLTKIGSHRTRVSRYTSKRQWSPNVNEPAREVRKSGTKSVTFRSGRSRTSPYSSPETPSHKHKTVARGQVLKQYMYLFLEGLKTSTTNYRVRTLRNLLHPHIFLERRGFAGFLNK